MWELLLNSLFTNGNLKNTNRGHNLVCVTKEIMKNPIVLSLLAMALCLNAYGDTYSVDSTTSVPISTAPLQMGVTYLFEASGTYQFDVNNRGELWADAEWMDYYALDDSGNKINELGIVEKRGLGVSEDILDLVIDGLEVDWLGYSGSGWAAHTYSPSHVYRYYYTGTGNPATLVIADWQPLVDSYANGDNAGSLRVKISPVPEGGAMLCLLGSALAIIGALRPKFRK